MPASQSALPSPFLCLAVAALGLACIFSASPTLIHAASNIPFGSKLDNVTTLGVHCCCKTIIPREACESTEFMPASHSALPSPFLCLAVAALGLACIFSASTTLIHAASDIPFGSKLVPGDVTGWLSSPNQLFRLAFYPNPQNSNSFSIGILYNAASAINSTVVWTAGGDIQVGSSGSFEFSAHGDLILKDDSGAMVWNSKTVAASAILQDDGDFALLDDSGVVLWQSFATPTDTLVFNQTLKQGENLTAGSYSANMQATGNLTLSYNGNGGYTYWSSDTAGGTAPYHALLENYGSKLSIYDQSQFLRGWYSKDYIETTPTRRVTLDSDGNLRIYTWSAGSSTPGWAVGWEALEDHCQIYAYCGPNGLCGYNETSVICTCVAQAGYDFNDTRNPRSGCKAIAGHGDQNCTGTNGAAIMVELHNTLLFVSDAGLQNRKFRAGDQDCSAGCLQNPLCTAATPLSDGSGTCQITATDTFYSGYQELSTSTNSYFKYCGSNMPPAGTGAGALLGPALSPGAKKSAVTVSVVISVLATLAILALLQAGVWWICCRKNPRWGRYSAHYALMEYASGAPVQLTYKELRRATGNFKEKLGEGGFGAVYKGELPTTSDTGGRGPATEVAVKRLEGLAEHGEKQFRMEMAVIGSTHHMNLVRLCGFCAEGKERLLVYEYMRNGSLDKYLFAGGEAAGGAEDTTGINIAFAGACNMDWETRFSVLLGTARGITYLHQECRDCIIHSDIKPENILLDDTFTAKVSDFGLAKLSRVHQNPSGRHVTTLVRGTRGYLAPEWRSNLPIMVKSDVYSFGVVVLETVSGRKSFAASTRHVSFPEWAYRQYFQHKQVEGVVDERIREEVDLEQLDRTMKVVFWCVHVQPLARPSMSKVIQMLDGSLAVPQIPPMHKSFGVEGSSTMNEDVTIPAFEQESPFYPTTTSLSFSHPPTNYSLSQSLVSRPTAPPRDAHVPYSF